MYTSLFFLFEAHKAVGSAAFGLVEPPFQGFS